MPTKRKAKQKAKRRKPGRPKISIDWHKVDRMLEAGCMATGIAATLGIAESSLRKRCEIDKKLRFSEYRQQKAAKGNDLLRMKQFESAMSGNITMQIWLGKQRLDQSEKSKTELTGANAGPIEVIKPQADD